MSFFQIHQFLISILKKIIKLKACKSRKNWHKWHGSGSTYMFVSTDYGRPMKPFFVEIQNFWDWADKLGRQILGHLGRATELDVPISSKQFWGNKMYFFVLKSMKFKQICIPSFLKFEDWKLILSPKNCLQEFGASNSVAYSIVL
jgi:hypothetical protein